MRKLFIVIITAFYSITLQAQPDLIPYRKGDKWGYSNRDEKLLMKPRYEEASLFFNNQKIAIVKKNGKLGIINRTFKEIVKPKYQSIEKVLSTLHSLKAKKGNRWALINPQGYLVTRPKYNGIVKAFFGKYILVEKHKKKERLYGLINQQGKELIPTKYHALAPFLRRTESGWFQVTKGNKAGVFDINTQKEFIPTIYADVNLVSPYSKVFEVKKRVKGALQVGVCDSAHHLLVPIKYDKVRLHAGHFIVNKNAKVGCYHRSGKLILPPQYDDLHATYASQKGKFYYTVSLKGKVAILDDQSKIVKPWVKKKYLAPEVIETVDDEEEIIADNLEVVLIDEVPPPPPPGTLTPYQANDKWGFKMNGKIIITHKYDEVSPFAPGSKLTKVKYQGKWGYINRQGVEYFEE